MHRSPLFMVKSIAGLAVFTLMLGFYDNMVENYEPDCKDDYSSPLCEVRELNSEAEPVKEPDPGELDREKDSPPEIALFGDYDPEAAPGGGIRVAEGWTQAGVASWYGENFHEGPTASGETYDMYTMTAAHRKLPFNTYVEVTCLDLNRSVVVRINNRGPYAGEDRIIDLSKKAAEKLDMKGRGLAKVKIEVIDTP